MMLTADQMPDDNAKLAAIPVEVPEVSLDGIVSPDTFVDDLLEYLEMEDFTPEGGLQFIRAANLDDRLYYIWKFASAGDHCYATISIKDGSSCRGCHDNPWGLTPEQFMLADYHHCM